MAPSPVTSHALELLRYIDRATDLDAPPRLEHAGHHGGYQVVGPGGSTPSPARIWGPETVGQLVIAGMVEWVTPTAPGVERTDWRLRVSPAGLELLGR